MLDYIRIACAVPPVQVGNVKKNAADICQYIAQADAEQTDVILFPELALTGYTCGDLFFQRTLLDAAVEGLQAVLACSRNYSEMTVVVGLPLDIDGLLYNCAAVLRGGILQGIVPKTYLPNHREFSEKRHFAPAAALRCKLLQPGDLGLAQQTPVPLGGQNIFSICDGVKLGVEICEDLWAPIPPSTKLALAGAQVIVNPAASNETVEKRALRQALVKHQSAACSCVYAFCSAGAAESTQDTVFSGHTLIAQNGKILAENAALADSAHMCIIDADIGIIRAARMENTSFRDAAQSSGQDVAVCGDVPGPARSDGRYYKLSKAPFLPADPQTRLQRCTAAFQIQAAGLKRRLALLDAKAVVGVSGGLDSTLALLVAVETMRQLGRPASDVYGITMPCFGTTDRTYHNACQLMDKLGVTSCQINIHDAVTAHFRDIGHDPRQQDTTYENAQARERTQVLMDYAGKIGGIVIGTGDLSELALGWCTYNADHMSMYNVNGSVPKTMIRYIIDAAAQMSHFVPAAAVLRDILDTPISPELLPPDAAGTISQCTEQLVGPYALHDFFLYHVLRNGFAPQKIYAIACRAFADEFDPQTVKKWLKTFYHRFFTQQFKRNCQPDGVKIGSVCLNPRGDWNMPSDASARLWLDEVEKL